MNYEQMQIFEEKTKQVHHDLANALISISMIRAQFHAWSPERRAKYEAHWKSIYGQAFENINDCLVLINHS